MNRSMEGAKSGHSFDRKEESARIEATYPLYQEHAWLQDSPDSRITHDALDTDNHKSYDQILGHKANGAEFGKSQRGTTTSETHRKSRSNKAATLTIEALQGLGDIPLYSAADKLGVSPSALKAACRRLGLARWPRSGWSKPQSAHSRGVADVDLSYSRQLFRKYSAAAPRPPREVPLGGSTAPPTRSAEPVSPCSRPCPCPSPPPQPPPPQQFSPSPPPPPPPPPLH